VYAAEAFDAYARALATDPKSTAAAREAANTAADLYEKTGSAKAAVAMRLFTKPLAPAPR